jgi:type VI protein secretion system component Hcp
MDAHTPDEPQPEETNVVEAPRNEESELSDEALDSVSGGDITIMKHTDSSSPKLYGG